MKPRYFKRFKKPDNLDKLIELVKTEDFSKKSIREMLPNQKDTRIVIGYFNMINDIPGFANKDVLNKYFPLCTDILEDVKLKYGYDNIIIKGFNIVKLNAKSIIDTHIDEVGYYEQGHRIHIPLITNPLCIFTVDGVEKNFDVGETFELNNTVSHSVINNGNDRIHIIIDLVGSSYFEDCINNKIPKNFYKEG